MKLNPKLQYAIPLITTVFCKPSIIRVVLNEVMPVVTEGENAPGIKGTIRIIPIMKKNKPHRQITHPVIVRLSNGFNSVIN
jgi:hypothetical protein